MVFVHRNKFVKSIYSIEHVKYKHNERLDDFIKGQAYSQGLKDKQLEDFEYLILIHAMDGYIYVIPYDYYSEGYDVLRQSEDSHKIVVTPDTLVLKYLDKYKEDSFELA